MIASGGLISANDAVVKWLTTGLPAGEIMFFRSLFMMIPMGLLAWRFGGSGALRVRNVPGQLLRGAMAVASAFFFVGALAFLPLADAIAISFASPLFITALARPLLGERVGWRRWAAVVAGFAGVLVMIRPTGEAANWAALLPLGAALSGALRDLMTRRISATETSVSMLCVSAVLITLAGLSSLPLGWQVPGAADLGLLAVAGFLIGGAQYLAIEAFRHAEATLVAPFKYTSLLWGVLLGFVVWGDLPDRWMIAGAVPVIGGGLYIWYREARR